MAEIKINDLKTNTEKSEEIIDLRSEAAASNSKAFTAFTTLRGGLGTAALAQALFTP